MTRLLLAVALALAAAWAAFRLWPDLPARFTAWLMDQADRRQDQVYGDIKRRLLGELRGTVVEIGPGTGANLRYFDPSVHWIGVEPNPHMRRRLEPRLGPGQELREGSAERLDLPDASVDAVVCTLVLCSVEDPDRILAEVRRVLRPGGRFVAIEHVAAPRGTALRRLQRAVRPVWRTFGHGCRPDRETWRHLERAGFRRLALRHRRLGLFFLVSPHVVAEAEA